VEEGPTGPRYLVARAAGQRVAIPLEEAREIVHARQVTRLPGAVPWVAGLFNLRGTVLTVLDVAVRLGGSASTGPVIVVEVEERSVGLRVDGVDAVVMADGEEQQVAAARSADGGVRGTVMTHDGEALVLDVAALQRTALAEV
jgi:purine-binding chemotaxis protein CheW